MKVRKAVETQHITGGLAQWRQLSRRQFCANLNVIPPQQVQWKPPLRQAAGTLGVIWRKVYNIDKKLMKR